jgi:hypothetical protein
MFGLFAKSTTENQEDTTAMEMANYNLSCRMEAMLEKEHLRKMRFSTIENTPSYYR